MERTAIELTIQSKDSRSTLYCEGFRVTSTGYLAIDFFDGGYSCCIKLQNLVSVRTVQRHSLFSSMKDVLEWKEKYHL